MKKIVYTMELLSSLIISPRSSQALYKDIDDFCVPTNLQIPENVQVPENDDNQITVVYPFYQYGEYKKYDPENAEYYLPGSSIKGAFLRKNKTIRNCMADDVVAPNASIVLRNLWKAQYLENEKTNKAKFDVFFKNVGIEMIENGTMLHGELYIEETIDISDVLKSAHDVTKNKMEQMCKYLSTLLKKEYPKTLKDILTTVEKNLLPLQDDANVILLGGYKGLLHSILLDNMSEAQAGLFVDKETMLPHGLVRIKFEEH